MNIAKEILVTGSSRGIGKAIAVDLKNAGYKVILHGRTESDALLKLADELSSEYIVFDVADSEAAKKALHKYTEKALYGIVLNAGISKDNTFVGLYKALPIPRDEPVTNISFAIFIILPLYYLVTV